MQPTLAATGGASPTGIPISFDAGPLSGFRLRVRDGRRVVQVWSRGQLLADLRVGDEGDEINLYLDRVADGELEPFGRAIGRGLEIAAAAKRRGPPATGVGVRMGPPRGAGNGTTRSLTAIRAVRRSLDGLRIAVMAVAIAAVALAHLAPMVGSEPVVIRGRSMEPSIPLGSLVLLGARDPAEIAVGDVVTRRTASGTLVTHRVVRVAQIDGVTYFETRGDASSSADPVLAAPGEIAGTVMLHLPFAGYVVAYLAQPLGIVSVVGLLLALLLAASLLEEIERERRAPPSVTGTDTRALRGGSAVPAAVPA